MKAICICVLVCSLAVLSAAQQPLGDVAREQRANRKPAAKVITNDDFSAATVANNGAASLPAKAEPDAKTDNEASSDKESPSASAETAKEGTKAKASVPSDPASRDKDYRTRYVVLKSRLGMMEHELDLLQREYKLQTVTYYTDAGTRLRNDKEWAEKRRKFEADIADATRNVDSAKQKIEDLKEEARRSGVPLRVFDE